MTRTALTRALLVAALFCACAAPDPGAVQREWNQTLREMGINPIFPPREDVQVGDVYARRGDPSDPRLAEEDTYAPIDLWVAAIPMGPELEQHYLARAVLPRTKGDEPTGFTSETVAWGTRSDESSAQPASAPREGLHESGPTDGDTLSSVFDQRDLGRLRTVAFPDFMSMTISRGDLRGLVPVQALQVAFGVNWSNEHTVSVKIPSAESCGLPFEVVRVRLDADLDGVLDEGIVSLSSLRMLHADQKKWAAANSNLSKAQAKAIQDDAYMNLDVISEVYYARVIEISIGTKKDRGATAGTPQAGGEEAQPPEPAAVDNPPDAFDRAKEMNAVLAEIQGQALPGGRFQFVSVSDSAVSMRRTFDHPIAIGYRGIQLRVDPQSGRIETAGGASERVAQTTKGDAVAVSAALTKAVAKVLWEKHDILISVKAAEASVQGTAAGELVLVVDEIRAASGAPPTLEAARNAMIQGAADIAAAMQAGLQDKDADTLKLANDVGAALASGRFKLESSTPP